MIHVKRGSDLLPRLRGEGGPKGRMRGSHHLSRVKLPLICLPASSPRERGEEGFYGDLDSLPWVVQVELWAALTLVFKCSTGRKPVRTLLELPCRPK